MSSMSSNMNIDELIALVRKKPQLWDRGNKFHSNRNVVDKCWREIAEIMKEDEQKLRKKWKYLRDQFSVEFGKIPPADCEEELLSYEPKWRYYKSLQFLEEVVTPRVSSKNPRREGDSSDGSQDTSAPGSPRPQNNEIPRMSRYNQRIDMKKHKLRYLREKQKLKRPSEMVNEEHLHFFKSLLPHVRNIPPHLQLSFRNRVQEVVEEYAYRQDPTATHNGTINEPYFITCVPDHTTTKFEPQESVDDSQDQDDMKDDDGSS